MAVTEKIKNRHLTFLEDGEVLYDYDFLLSETDYKGIITYANDAFADVANYTIEELIGQPHNIIRHPDMPKIAFKGLWDDIKTKGFWSGYVKNARRGGGYYWVYATVLRKVNSEGKITYVSLRTKPTRSAIAEHDALYKTLV